MKFSIKQLLIVIVPLSVYFACLASAVRGSSIGGGLAVSVPAVAIWFLCLATVYWGALLISKLTRGLFHRPSAVDRSQLDATSFNNDTSTTEVPS